MTSRERMLKAINREKPDRLPATTHHVMTYFLDTYMNSMSIPEFFDHFGLDAVTWTDPHKPGVEMNQYYDSSQKEIGFLESHRITSDNWRITPEELPNDEYKTIRYLIETPRGTLTMVTQANEHTRWISEHLVKEKNDIDLIGEFVTAPLCDTKVVNKVAREFGDRGIVRGGICGFDIFGQPGCWQDASCLVGIEKLIMATFDDPEWVHSLLEILQKRKKFYVHSLKSSTVISPEIFDKFVAPYDRELISIAHEADQKVIYHTCGGMMPFLEKIADMEPDAMETFTPPGMGGDVDLAEAKKRIGDRVCMVGGFDQFHFFKDCTPDKTRAEVRRCFEAAGGNGGFILCPSDHFFDADPECIMAYADEAWKCIYD
jgi:hypothetical protein